MRKRKEDIGLSPYELKFRGPQRSRDVEMTLFDIDSEEVKQFSIQSIGEVEYYKSTPTLTWLNIDGLHDERSMGELVDTFQIPANILSDVMEPSTRPQMEEFDAGLFITIKMIELNDEKKLMSVNNLSVIVMNNMVITFQEEASDFFNPVKERIRTHAKRFQSMGVGYLTFALLDVVIDNYIYLLETYGEKIENLENELILDPGKETLMIINHFKRELSHLGRNIRPAREVVMSLVKSDSELLTPENEKHYKELQDNISQAIELLEYYSELLYDALNIYHSSMSTKLNDKMALLTIFSVIFIPITFIVGVYGMNFENMPELHLRYGYFIVLGVMLIIALAMLMYFKKRKWY